MKEFRTRISRGHLFFDRDGETVLLDTGSPISVRPGGLVDLDEISRNVGTRVDELMGNDAYGAVYVDEGAARIILYSEQEADRDDLMPMPFKSACEDIMGVPTVRVKINGLPARMFIDTGAVVGYVNRHYVEKGMPVRRTRDFYPMQGTFDVDVYDTQVEVGVGPMRISRRMELGVLPPALNLLEMIGCDGILGREFFKIHGMLINRVRGYWGFVGI